MPVEGAASFEVLVGGAPCHEYAHDGKTYVEMDLQHATSYDCKYVDDTPHGTEESVWPVTPFEASSALRVSSESVDSP